MEVALEVDLYFVVKRGLVISFVVNIGLIVVSVVAFGVAEVTMKVDTSVFCGLVSG